MTKKQEKYITEIPAIKRQEKCEWCGQRFFKTKINQILCEDCETLREDEQEYEQEQEYDDTISLEAKGERWEAEKAQREKEESLEDSQRC